MKNYWQLVKSYKISTLIVAFAKEIHRKLWRELVRGSYAQNYDDLILNNIFSHINKGIYLEIGAYHPTRLSNTYYFYKKGWKGYVVEPNPEVYNIFRQIRPRDKFINAGVGENNGIMKYYNFLIPAINTFSKQEYLKNIRNGHKLNDILNIRVISIGDLIKKYKISKIDLLSIDAEGFDEIILNNWPWEICKPSLICVEMNADKILNRQGYFKVTQIDHNRIYLLAVK